MPAAEWLSVGQVKMCRQSYEDCQKALELELNNAAYYKCSLGNAGNQITEAMFDRLMEQELEHAEIFATALGVETPALVTRKCHEDDGKNLRLSNRHEAIAIKFYTEAANRAPEPRIVQIFRALAEVENQHLVLTNTYLFR
ncbi:MAG TPA: ferritin family protein [Bacillota bacterium]|nr:ferritin family protein [Bacillota bacterium]